MNEEKRIREEEMIRKAGCLCQCHCSPYGSICEQEKSEKDELPLCCSEAIEKLRKGIDLE